MGGVFEHLGGVVATVVVVVCLLALYFLPTIIAWRRGHRSRTAIFLLNLALAGTIVGWVVALGWALGWWGGGGERVGSAP